MENQDVDRVEASESSDDYAPPALEDLGTFAELTQLSSAGTFDLEGAS